jgi:hypothetical protein
VSYPVVGASLLMRESPNHSHSCSPDVVRMARTVST